MSYEVKRVPLTFDWPLDKIWDGFVNPNGPFPPCPDCSYAELPTIMDRLFPQSPRGTGYTPEAFAVSQTFYAYAIGGPMAEALAWSDKLGQAEVDNLVAAGRLRVWRDGKWASEPRLAAEVNAANRRGGIDGHDGLNRMILIRFRCEQLGIKVSCPTCKGEGDAATDEERRQHEEWEPSEPPTGEGWQVWEDVSEGAPVTPVFPTAGALVQHLVEHGTTWDVDRVQRGRQSQAGWRREAAVKFVDVGGSLGSFVTVDGEMFDGSRDIDQITRQQ